MHAGNLLFGSPQNANPLRVTASLKLVCNYARGTGRASPDFLKIIQRPAFCVRSKMRSCIVCMVLFYCARQLQFGLLISMNVYVKLIIIYIPRRVFTINVYT